VETPSDRLRASFEVSNTAPLLTQRRWDVTLMTAPARPALARRLQRAMHDLARRRTGRRLVGVDAARDGHQPPVRVLIVDDSAPFRTAARELLRRRGYVVVGEAGNATEAIEAAELLAPDAVLLDLHLPDGCGFEVSAVLTGARPELAVLLISADDSPPPDGRVEACGARGFVPKSCLAATPLERFWPAP
jgi:CheY-like chemotaxis protein